jgi:hypothetical protein
MLTQYQIEKLDAIAAEVHDRDEYVRDSLSAYDFEDWAVTLDVAEMYDLADRVRAVFRDD